MHENLKKLLLNATPLIIVGLGLVFTIFLILNIQERGKQTDTYLKFEVCSLNIPPGIKTQEKINACWQRVEKSTGLTVDHFNE